MDIKIKKIDWEQTIKVRMAKANLKQKDILKGLGKSGNFDRDVLNFDNIKIPQLIKLSEVLDYNLFYEFCDLTEVENSNEEGSGQNVEQGFYVKKLIETNNNLSKTNKNLSETINEYMVKIKELEGRLSLLKKTGT